MRISDWSSDVCSSDALDPVLAAGEGRLEREEVDHLGERQRDHREVDAVAADRQRADDQPHRGRHRHPGHDARFGRSEEHTSELQSLMRISYAVFCLKKKTNTTNHHYYIEYI